MAARYQDPSLTVTLTAGVYIIEVRPVPAAPSEHPLFRFALLGRLIYANHGVADVPHLPLALLSLHRRPAG